MLKRMDLGDGFIWFLFFIFFRQLGRCYWVLQRVDLAMASFSDALSMDPSCVLAGMCFI